MKPNFLLFCIKNSIYNYESLVFSGWNRILKIKQRERERDWWTLQKVTYFSFHTLSVSLLQMIDCRLTLFIASSSFIILTLITIIGAVSCFILCNEEKELRTQKSFIQSMSSSSNLNLNLLGQNNSTGNNCRLTHYLLFHYTYLPKFPQKNH